MEPRKRLIVDKKFQYSYILKNVLFLFFTFALMFAVLKVWEHYQVKQGFLLRLPPNSQVVAWAKENNVSFDSAAFARRFIEKAEVYTYFSLLWKPMTIVLVLNAIILIIANIYYSHKIAGPIHRLKQILERKISGEEIGPIIFRKGDEFHELAEVINRLLTLEKK